MSAIKPPDGRPTSVAPTGQGSSETGAAQRSSGPSFRQALDEARAATGSPAAGTVGAGGTAGAAAADPIAQLASAVRSGAVSAEQAIERLLDRAVGGVSARLSQDQRAELTAVLRQALEHDPALRELRDALK
jgi:hypothetical protein